MAQLALFTGRSPYPDGLPGHARAETSREAAVTVAATLTERHAAVLADIAAHGDATPDETAARLGWHVWSTRPRFTELARLGRIEDTGQRRATPQGASARVWRVCR